MVLYLRKHLKPLLNFPFLNKDHRFDFFVKSSEVLVIYNFALCLAHGNILLDFLMSTLNEQDFDEQIFYLAPKVGCGVFAFFFLLDSNHFSIFFQLGLFQFFFLGLLNLHVLGSRFSCLRFSRRLLFFFLFVFFRGRSAWLSSCYFESSSICFRDIKWPFSFITFFYSSLSKSVVFVINQALSKNVESFEILALAFGVYSG